MQVFSQHQQGHLPQGQSQLEVAGPPAFVWHLDKPLQIHLVVVSSAALDHEMAGPYPVFWTLLQPETVPTGP